MKLGNDIFANRGPWERAGIKVPGLDRAAMLENTAKAPVWVHFGAGNIFRAFIAKTQQELLEKGLSDKGIVAAFTMEPDVIDALWKPCDNLSLSVTLNTDGTTEKEVVASVSECLYTEDAAQFERLKAIFASPSLQLVSFTITEKGYDPGGSAMKRLRELILARPKELPLALVSMDNCARNGEVLKKGLGDLPGYDKLSFPWSMIDKITPRPDEGVKNSLKELGFENADTVVTPAGTYASAFVNAEKAQYLIIEDDFPNGRPPLERAGVIFTSRETVNLCEKMKVGACLNPLHTCMAIFGVLLRFGTIADEIRDPDVRKLVERLGYGELLPAVKDPGILKPEEFLRECLDERFANPFLPDTPARIATDSSQKIPVRFGETVKYYFENDPERLKTLEIVPFTFAGWCRYLTGTDDGGEPFEPSPDPLLGEVVPLAKAGDLKPVLSRAGIFGVDLYSTPLAEKTELYFKKMTAGPGAVRAAIKELTR